MSSETPCAVIQERQLPEEREEEEGKGGKERGRERGEGIPAGFSPTPKAYILSCPIILCGIILCNFYLAIISFH